MCVPDFLVSHRCDLGPSGHLAGALKRQDSQGGDSIMRLAKVRRPASSPNSPGPGRSHHEQTSLAPELRSAALQPRWIQKHLLLSAISLISRFRSRSGSVLMLSGGLCVKYGRRLDLVEAQTMIFISRCSNVPVPKVYMAFEHKGYTYILMERIRGTPLGRGWFQRSASSRLKVLASLRDAIIELRTLGTKSSAISSLNGGSLYDPRMPCIEGRFGPFRSIEEFHEYLRDGIQPHDDHLPGLKRLIDLHGEQWEGPTFTHGDLSSLNIIARGDRVVGIVDWETAGWYPTYWEYTTACQVNPQNAFWSQEIDHFLTPMPKALEMEQLRQRYFGDV